MSLMSDTAGTRVPSDDEIQTIVFRLRSSLASAKRFAASDYGPETARAGVLDALSTAQEQFNLLQAWFYNNCYIGD